LEICGEGSGGSVAGEENKEERDGEGLKVHGRSTPGRGRIR